MVLKIYYVGLFIFNLSLQMTWKKKEKNKLLLDTLLFNNKESLFVIT